LRVCSANWRVRACRDRNRRHWISRRRCLHADSGDPLLRREQPH
jgi:hypothetical protein